MRLRVSYLALPKAGNSEDEFEDAYYPIHPSTEGIVRDRFRFGVSDGATEGYLSRHWANCLVQSFQGASSVGFDETFARALERWARWLTNYLELRARNSRPLQWFEEAKLEEGAFATLLGVQFRSRPGNQHSGGWAAVALGDTCLFQVRSECLKVAFPVSQANYFDNTPPLVPSKPKREDIVSSFAHRATGDWEHGDAFFLATDALSAWFLTAVELGQAPWRILRDLDTDEQPPFPEWVRVLREERLMRNDDVTLVRVEID